MADSYQRIFVSHVAGIGQTVLALPALHALRAAFPQARITVASSYSAFDVVRLSHYANEIFPVGRASELIHPRATFQSLKSLRTLRREQFDVTIELQRGTAGGVARFLAQLGAPKKHRKLLTQIREAILRHSLADRHAAQRYLEIIGELGAFPLDREPRLYTEREADARLDMRLEKSGLATGGLLIGLHPGAGHNKPRWPLERFLVVAEKLIHVLNARVFVFAGPHERGLARAVVKQLPTKHALAFDAAPLADVTSAFARLSVLITNHGGPAHLAAAVGTPVVALSPLMVSHANDLLSLNHVQLRKPSLDAISTDEVFEAACQLVQANRAEYLWAR
ncbi:MAG TPA: glycosyltransferase family 9 protein [Blastocatellia bacterium]|nr:glycosyltransferase family 9 protein [Blastocatellia bacterium]